MQRGMCMCVCAPRGWRFTSARARVKRRLGKRTGNGRRGWEWSWEREMERGSFVERTNGLNISVGKQTRVETNSGFSRSIGQGSALNLASTRNSNRVKYTASGTPCLTKRGAGGIVALLFARFFDVAFGWELAKYLDFHRNVVSFRFKQPRLILIFRARRLIASRWPLQSVLFFKIPI